MQTRREISAILAVFMISLTAGLLSSLLLPTVLRAEEPADAKKQALAALHGTWQADSLINNGEEQQDVPLKLRFAEEKLVATLGDTDINLTFTIDPLCTPKVIDLAKLADDSDQEETRLEGIYEVSENTLRLCLMPPEGPRARPQKFESPVDSQIILVTLTRIAP